MTDTTSRWRKRVERWRASGETAEVFSGREGFAPSTLRWWSSKLARAKSPAPMGMVQLIRVPAAAVASPGRGTVVIDLVGSVVTGKLVADGTSFRVEEGQLAGRWATGKLLTSLQALHDPFDQKQYLCNTDPAYQNVKAAICKGADVTTDLKTDGTNTPCDALSIAIGFTASPAHLGSAHEHIVTAPPCGATYHDDCNAQ